MQLIGMLDSPYVRRVAVSLQLLGLRFTHQPISVFSGFDQFRRISPVVKAPSLVCADGTVLLDSTLILDHAESIATGGRSLMPRDPASRLQALRVIGLALAACEKSVQIIYERNLRPVEKQFDYWLARLHYQLNTAYAGLEAAVVQAPGYRHSGRLPIVSAVCAHHGEEPAISGTRGSRTVFFGNCNMICVYCQNYQISHDWRKQQSKEMDCRTLAERMLYLQDALGCHNINFVSPSHFVPQLLRAVAEAVPGGLRVPLVYNSSGYDSVASLKELDGVISIYLPDLRYASDKWAGKFSRARGYVTRARQAIKEMYNQLRSTHRPPH